jgi:hypothetical protein
LDAYNTRGCSCGKGNCIQLAVGAATGNDLFNLRVGRYARLNGKDMRTATLKAQFAGAMRMAPVASRATFKHNGQKIRADFLPSGLACFGVGVCSGAWCFISGVSRHTFYSLRNAAICDCMGLSQRGLARQERRQAAPHDGPVILRQVTAADQVLQARSHAELWAFRRYVTEGLAEPQPVGEARKDRTVGLGSDGRANYTASPGRTSNSRATSGSTATPIAATVAKARR